MPQSGAGNGAPKELGPAQDVVSGMYRRRPQLWSQTTRAHEQALSLAVHGTRCTPPSSHPLALQWSSTAARALPPATEPHRLLGRGVKMPQSGAGNGAPKELGTAGSLK